MTTSKIVEPYEFERDLQYLIQMAYAEAVRPFAHELSLFQNATIDIAHLNPVKK